MTKKHEKRAGRPSHKLPKPQTYVTLRAIAEVR